MVDVIKKLGDTISSAVHLDANAEYSGASGPYESKPLPKLPQSIELCAGEVNKLDIVIEHQVKIPSVLADHVNVVLPSLTDDIKTVLGDSVVNDGKHHGAKCAKHRNAELFMDLPKELSAEMRSLHQVLTEEVVGFGGGYYLHPKKIVEIPQELSHQIRSLHDVLNKEVLHGAELLHPKEIAEIPPALSQDIRSLRGALNCELVHGADVLHPKEIIEVPPDLSSEIRKLHDTLNEEVEFGADYLHPKKLVEVPAELDIETQIDQFILKKEIENFGSEGHLKPKQIAEIPVDLSQQVQELHDALNKQVVQFGGPKHLHPKHIGTVPAEVTAKERRRHSFLIRQMKCVGGPQILHPKDIAEIPPDLCHETRNLHDVLTIEVRLIRNRLLHPKEITEIPAELCHDVREAHKHLNKEVSLGAYHLHPKQVVEIPAELDQQTRDLHEDLNAEVEDYGGVDRLRDDAGIYGSLEQPTDLSDSVKQMLPTLTKEVNNFDRLNKLRYAGRPDQYNHNVVTPKPMDMAVFQTYVEQMLRSLADSGSALSPTDKETSEFVGPNEKGLDLVDECVHRVVNTLIEAAENLREPTDAKAVLVDELNYRQGNIDVDDGAPDKQGEDLPKDENSKPFVDGDGKEAKDAHDSGHFDEKVNEPSVPAVATKEKGFLKMSKLLRRFSGWKTSHATLVDEEGTSKLAHTHTKGAHGMDMAMTAAESVTV